MSPLDPGSASLLETHSYLLFFPCFLLLHGPCPTCQQAVGPVSFRRQKALKDQLLLGWAFFCAGAMALPEPSGTFLPLPLLGQGRRQEGCQE